MKAREGWDYRMWLLALGALGIVYGDIGTSPLYALRESFLGFHEGGAVTKLTEHQVFGILSLVTWALVLVVIVKYLLVALRADNQGEGGILALLALLTARQASPGSEQKGGPAGRLWIVLLALTAAALLFADGLITPAISVLSAIEGLEVAAPNLERWVLPITAGILLALFLIQKHGTGKIGILFGPLMLIWFMSIGIVGLVSLLQHPKILLALNPWYGLELFINAPMRTFILLGAVVLVVTGAEALYADMGHFNRWSIRLAWSLVVMPALLLNYFGQGAQVLADHAAAKTSFWSIVPPFLHIPMLVIAMIATIIASQALISGAFSLTHQAMQLGYSPRFKVVHTSSTMIGQIFLPGLNTIMMVACIMLVLVSQKSSILAAMYGFAVTGTMTVTSILLYCVIREKWRWSRLRAIPVLVLFLIVDLAFFFSNLAKIDDGGWVTILIGGMVFTVMVVWYAGRRILAKPIYSISLPMTTLLNDLTKHPVTRVPGTAVFMTGRADVVPAVLLHHLKHNQVLHERVILLTVRTEPVPKIAEHERISVRPGVLGFWDVQIQYGFTETPDVPAALLKCKSLGLEIDPQQASYYLGRMTLRVSKRGGMPLWCKRLFNFLYHNERPITAYFNLPANRVIELGRQLEL